MNSRFFWLISYNSTFHLTYFSISNHLYFILQTWYINNKKYNINSKWRMTIRVLGQRAIIFTVWLWHCPPPQCANHVLLLLKIDFHRINNKWLSSLVPEPFISEIIFLSQYQNNYSIITITRSIITAKLNGSLLNRWIMIWNHCLSKVRMRWFAAAVYFDQALSDKSSIMDSLCRARLQTLTGRQWSIEAVTP